MSATNPLTRLSKAIFRGIPAPLLFFISLGLAGALLMPDFIPLVDEAVFALLLYGSVSTLRDKRRDRQLGPASEGLPVGKLSKSLDADCAALAARAAELRASGLPVPALDGLARLPDEVKALTDAVRRVDGYLSRKEHDPWQVGREVDRLERSVADAEADGSRGRMETLQIALEGARMLQREVADQTASRDATVAQMQALSSQVSTLSEILRVAAERDDVPAVPLTIGAGWDPRLAAVLAGLREAHAAHAEMEEAVAGGALGAAQRRQRSKA